MNECIVCGSEYRESFLPMLIKCQECDHVCADLVLDDKKLAKLYKKFYFFGGEYSNYLADKKVLQKNFRLRLDVLQNFTNPKRHKYLFEIGSAYGFFLDIAKGHFDIIKGIDISEDAVCYAHGKLNLDVIQGDFLKEDFGDLIFDVVCMWDTIEHLRDPHLYIQKISAHMKSGSLLAITTGDIESLNARIKKDKWRLIHPPTHIHYFSKKTLSILLHKNNFDIVYMRYGGFYRSIENIAYNMFILRKKHEWFYHMLRKIRVTRLDFYLNFFDIVYVIARKR